MSAPLDPCTVAQVPIPPPILSVPHTMYSMMSSDGAEISEASSLYLSDLTVDAQTQMVRHIAKGSLVFWLVFRVLFVLEPDGTRLSYGPRLAPVCRVYKSWMSDIKRSDYLEELGLPNLFEHPTSSLAVPVPMPVQQGSEAASSTGSSDPLPPPCHSSLPASSSGPRPPSTPPPACLLRFVGVRPSLSGEWLPPKAKAMPVPCRAKAASGSSGRSSVLPLSTVPPLLPRSTLPNRPPRPFIPLCPDHPIFPPGHFGTPVIGVATGAPYPMDAHLRDRIAASLRNRLA